MIRILQIQVEVFHAVATTAENGEDGSYYLAVLISSISQVYCTKIILFNFLKL